jgi:methylenetetrahydrofolate reductase (NADPH)
MPSVSFEYFPPRNENASNLLKETVEVLSQYQPDFQSVTYGASGSDRDGTIKTLDTVAEQGDGVVASHLTYTGSTPADVAEFANYLWEKNIRRIVALRGDSREANSQEYFNSTAQFVQTLKRHHDFDIAVACYPETHPLARSRDADLAVLKEKQDAGASRAITQFFFDNSQFYQFVEEARAAGITIPIVPGILPIYNFKKVVEMAKSCGTYIPQFIHDVFSDEQTCGDNENEVATEILKAQIHDLAIAGFESVHIYTLNRASLASIAADTFFQAHKDAQEIRKVA